MPIIDAHDTDALQVEYDKARAHFEPIMIALMRELELLHNQPQLQGGNRVGMVVLMLPMIAVRDAETNRLVQLSADQTLMVSNLAGPDPVAASVLQRMLEDAMALAQIGATRTEGAPSVQ